MRSEADSRYNVMNVLLKEFGEVETERFIFLIKKEGFDYTKWQRNLWADKSIEEVFEMAKQRENDRGKSVGQG